MHPSLFILLLVINFIYIIVSDYSSNNLPDIDFIMTS
jgi:hypothetical protein